MVLNDLLTRQTVFTKLILKDGDKELPKELKLKIMRIRMAYNKIKKAFEAEVKEFMKELITDELRILSTKLDRTPEEEARFKELNDSINTEYQLYLVQKGQESVNTIDDSITIDEYADIVEVNAGNDIEINGVKMPVADFLEIVYELFVKE